MSIPSITAIGNPVCSPSFSQKLFSRTDILERKLNVLQLQREKTRSDPSLPNDDRRAVIQRLNDRIEVTAREKENVDKANNTESPLELRQRLAIERHPFEQHIIDIYV